MPGTHLKFITGILLIVVAIIAINIFFLHDHIAFTLKTSLSVQTFDFLDESRALIDRFINIKNLASENIKLQEENNKLLSRAAKGEALKDENDFLKSALGLKKSLGSAKLIPGNIFSGTLIAGQAQLLLNKGLANNVEEGDIIILENQVVVGKIDKVFKKYSKIVPVTDINFKITAKILSGNTLGLIQGQGENNLKLDLVTQNDEIMEGDIIVSTGDDFMPAGLIIGTVSHVDVQESKIFKNVMVRPAFFEIPFSKVLVIESNN